MLGAIHFGKTEIQREIKFDDSCYYHITTDEDWTINRLIGLSYGYHKHNSISIGWRPSEKRLDKIDLFAIIYYRGVRTADYFHTIPINEPFAVKIKVNEEHPLISFRVFEIESGEKIANFMCNYQMPLFKLGYILNPKIKSKGRNNVGVYLSKSDFHYGSN